MKVVIASARYRPSLGGVETHAREIATKLGIDFDVTVVTSNPGSKLLSDEYLDGVLVKRVPTWPRKGDPFVPWGWSQVVRELRPDAVVIDGYQSVISARALMFATRHRIPSVLVFHEGANPNRLRQALYPLQRRVLGRWFRRANFTVATAPHELDLYRRQLNLSPDSLVYIPNGADLPTVDASINVEPGKVVSIGRLEKQKRHDLVINALAHLRRDGEPWRLTIIGHGEEKESLEGLADALGIAEYVTVTAFEGSEREQMVEELASAQLVIAPSLFETYPMAVIEAAHLGCHVVVPAEGNEGVAGLVQRRIAEAVNTSSAEVLARELREAAQRTFVADRSELISWDECALEFRRLLEKLSIAKGRSV